MIRKLALTALLLGACVVAVVPNAGAEPTPKPKPKADCELVDLGAPLASITVHEGGYGPGPDGTLLGYALVSGENAKLNVVDAMTGERVDAVPLPGASGGWAITVADSGTVYLGSYTNGTLYSYDPTTGEVTDHGRPIESESYLWGLSEGPDGTIYGGTYPGAHAFGFDPDTGEVTDFGRFNVGGSLYVRATAFAPETSELFVGLGATTARLYALDVTTREYREIALPDGVSGTAFSDLRYQDGKVFGSLDSQLVVFDAVTGEHLPLTDATTGEQVDATSIISRGVSDPLNGVVYYSDMVEGGTAQRLMTLDLASLEFAPAPRNDNAGPLAGAALGYAFSEGTDGPVLHAFVGNYSAQALEYDVTNGVLTKLGYDLLPTEPNLGHVIAGEQEVYVNAFLNGDTGQYDPATGETTKIARFGQVEGWTWHDGLLYSGSYPNGTVQVWDPADPMAAPEQLFSLKDSHHQNRPMTLAVDDERLYVGTTPGYGEFGGALTIYDFASQTFDVHRNIVPDQTVSAVLKVGDVVLGGSSIDGGTGTGDPIATEAKLFTADPVTGAVLNEYTPVPGARSINALTRASDGTIWGVADGTVFEFDLATGSVTRTIEVYGSDLTSSATDGELIEHPNGKLYGVSRNQTFVVDPAAETAAVLHSDVNRLALHPNGEFYTLSRTPGGGTQDTNRLAKFDPTTC